MVHHTSPYLPDAEARLRESVRHHCTVTAHPAAGAPFTLDTESLAVTFADDWSPHVQASITAAVPSDQAKLDALDPRKGCRIVIAAGYVYPGGIEDVHQLADLGLRTRPVSRPANTMALSAASDEALAQDYLKLSADLHPDDAGVTETVTGLLPYAVPAAGPPISDVPSGYGADELAGFTFERGESIWSVFDEAAVRTGVHIYCDGARQWRIEHVPQLAGKSSAILTTGQSGTITGSDSELSREGDWCNAVLVHYQWEDAAGEQRNQRAWAEVTSGPFNTTDVGYKAAVIERQGQATGFQARKAAHHILANLVTRGRSLSLNAHAAYWLRPGHTVSVQLPTGPAARHLIRSVEFDPLAGSMAITTRQPENVTITEGE